MSEHRVRLGVIGHGTVGAAFVRLVKQQSDTIAARSGVRLEVARVAVRNIDAHAGSIAAEVMTTDAEFVVNDPTVDLVVELMGGVDLPRKLILTALKNGKPVVTANKALLAQHGAELFAAADDAGIDLLFEAAVCGGIPLIRPLRESLRGEPIKRVLGIVNGTTNYILTKMSEEGQSYTDALAGAQALGYAEADPTADVEGLDAAAKVSIIASIAFGCNVVASDVYSEGISKISAADISIAKRLGYAVKLLAIAEYDKLNGEVSVRVHPAMVPMHHPLASVRDSFNAVVVDGEASGSLMFYGRGAGGDPTASSVLGDVIDASINLNKGAHATLGVLS
jgi:homoserine dehydrogenase